MLKDYAKFSATVAKGIKVGDTEVEIKLLLPLKVMQENFLFLSSNQGEKINVFMGDPQASFDFDEDDGEIYRELTGRRVTTDGSGVVTSIEKRDDGDPNQGALTFQEGDRANVGTDEVNFESDGVPGEGAVFTENGTPSGDGDAGEGSTGGESPDGFRPDWLSEDQGGGSAEGGQPGEDENDQGEYSEGADQETVEENGDGAADPAAEPEVSKDELDKFILHDRPIFPEIEFNGEPIPFPDLLEKRKREDKTWREIANERSMTSGQLSAKWTAYRKLAAKKMQGGGGAA